MKPFILLQTRPEDPAADNEYEAFMKFSGLGPDELRRLRIHDGDLPELKLNNYSGIFLGGGPYCVSYPDSKKTDSQKRCEAALSKLIDKVAADDLPMLAACFIGVLITHEGGEMTFDAPEVIGGYEMTLTDDGKTDHLLKGLPDSFTVFTGHKESISKLPENSTVLASTPSCPNQMIRIKDNIYACQFHPELDGEGLALRVQIYKTYGYFPPEDADKLISESKKHDVSNPVRVLRNFAGYYRNY